MMKRPGQPLETTLETTLFPALDEKGSGVIDRRAGIRQHLNFAAKLSNYVGPAHLALGKDAPESRSPASNDDGPIITIPEVGGLHHRYERLAA